LIARAIVSILWESRTVTNSRCLAVIAAAGLGALIATANAADERGPKLGEAQTVRLRVGIVVTAAGGPCKGIVATTPVPIDWPEQSVKIVDEEDSTYVKNVNYRLVAGTVKQMLVEIPQLPAGQEAKAIVTFEVKRHALLPPDDTELYRLPNLKKLNASVRVYLGDSPYIESRHTKIRNLARETLANKSDSNAWAKVEALYDVARAKVEYKDSLLKGALKALEDGNGDCEELSSLFIALCRASDIPARTVWVPGHCYAEFYLEDPAGEGYWFPCQPAGARAFGGIPEHRPILQKGDNFKVPERPRDRQRYVSEYLTGAGGQPKVQFIRENVANAN
jgi:transglutaminase-like putative cysteine protease